MWVCAGNTAFHVLTSQGHSLAFGSGGEAKVTAPGAKPFKLPELFIKRRLFPESTPVPSGTGQAWNPESPLSIKLI